MVCVKHIQLLTYIRIHLSSECASVLAAARAVVSRSDSDKCVVTRLVGKMTSLSLGELTCCRKDDIGYMTMRTAVTSLTETVRIVLT